MMKINKLSNFLLIFTILTNIGFSQIEDLKNSGLIEKSCKQDNGPWFFQYNNDVINETPELLSEDEISVITKDGVVVFCEGESKFSGLFTANELVLYGSGNVEDVMVSPIDYKYFNFLSLDMEELIEFIDFHDYASLNELNIKNIEIDNESNITILNTTFTQGDFIKKIHTISEDSNLLLSDPNCFVLPSNFDDSENFDVDFSDCIPDIESMTLLNTGIAVQIHRENSNILFENVNFKDLQFSTSAFNITSPMTNSILRNVNLLDNEFYAFPFLIGGTNYSLNNVNVINNKLKKSFGPRGWLNFNQSTITLFSENHNINGLEIIDNKNIGLFMVNGRLEMNDVLIKNNEISFGFDFLFTDENEVNITNLEFIENIRTNINDSGISPKIGPRILFFGSGKIDGFKYEKNETSFFPLMFRSAGLEFSNSSISYNTSNFPYLINNIGHIRFSNSQFVDNKLNANENQFDLAWPQTLIIPRTVFDEEFCNACSNGLLTLDGSASYEDIREHKIVFNDVFIQHLPSKKIESTIFSVNSLEDYLEFDCENNECIDGRIIEPRDLRPYIENDRSNSSFDIFRYDDIIESLECQYYRRSPDFHLEYRCD